MHLSTYVRVRVGQGDRDGKKEKRKRKIGAPDPMYQDNIKQKQRQVPPFMPETLLDLVSPAHSKWLINVYRMTKKGSK